MSQSNDILLNIGVLGVKQVKKNLNLLKYQKKIKNLTINELKYGKYKQKCIIHIFIYMYVL